jgi:DNA-binding MarR family transcriptional regulator
LQEEKWYNGRRKPRLQIKILENIALSGDLSKAKARDLLKQHHYPEISQAFDSLEKKGMIKFSRGEPGRGRKERFYKITEKGIASLMVENPQPRLFWQALLQYCQRKEAVVSLDDVELLFGFFIQKYLKYSADHIYYISQIDHFNRACDTWLQRIKGYSDSEKISAAQKVVEALALKPKMTLDELAAEIKESREDTEKIISSYSFRPVEHVVIDKEFVQKYHAGKIDAASIMNEHWEFLLHSIIIAIEKDDDDDRKGGASVYELSLFGAIVALALIRHNDAGMLKLGLYYSKTPLQDYFDKVATNYKDKLPLIFGKWNLLKMILKIFSAYNFDIIIDKETRLNSDTAPSILGGGSREFLETAKAIALHNHHQLSQVHIVGFETYHNHKFSVMTRYRRQVVNDKNTIEKETTDKTIAIYQTLLDIGSLLDFADLSVAQEEIKKYADPRSERIKQLSTSSQISILEKAFAEEITLLYYLGLHNDGPFSTMLQPTKYLSSIYSDEQEEQLRIITNNVRAKAKKKKSKSGSAYDPLSILREPTGLTLKVRLQIILRRDRQVRQWLSSWIKDSVTYNKEIVDRMVQLYDEIKE